LSSARAGLSYEEREKGGFETRRYKIKQKSRATTDSALLIAGRESPLRADTEVCPYQFKFFLKIAFPDADKEVDAAGFAPF